MQVQSVRLEVKLGDIVRACGVREHCLSSGAPVLHCTAVVLVKSWTDMRSGNAQVSEVDEGDQNGQLPLLTCAQKLWQLC